LGGIPEEEAARKADLVIDVVVNAVTKQ
jgi:hypothetical protein